PNGRGVRSRSQSWRMLETSVLTCRYARGGVSPLRRASPKNASVPVREGRLPDSLDRKWRDARTIRPHHEEPSGGEHDVAAVGRPRWRLPAGARQAFHARPVGTHRVEVSVVVRMIST